jgi:WD40 repeat protein
VLTSAKKDRAVVRNAFAAESSYDVFLSYNSADHRVVEDVARKLRDKGLEPFLDRWYLAPGMPWRSKLEESLNSCKAVAIFVGPGEMGSWQQREIDVALDLRSRDPNLPVIPVLLAGCEPPLGFLRQLTWVDLRTQTLDLGINTLAKAIQGHPSGPDLQERSDAVCASICPYRGLLHFRVEDAPIFFGRETTVNRLVCAVQRESLVAVVGASGSGKSSVVRAGLVHRLRSDRGTAWETIIMVPTDQPFKALARALVPFLEPTKDEIDRLAEAAKLGEHLRSAAISLNDVFESILEQQSGTNRVLLVVDQFEELFTLNSDEEARRRFLDVLLTASSATGSRANIVLTLRGDFVGKALTHRPLSDRLQDAQINLGPMTREELECVIRKPAEKIGLEFEPGLLKRIINDVGHEPGNLPLLEFVLKELWDKRRGSVLLNDVYDAIGGLQGAVATKADELVKGLSAAEQKVLQRIFLRIVRPSESGLDTRRRAAFTELPPEGMGLVVKLANERLLVTGHSAVGLEQTVEIAHEALISNWGTLRAWVKQDREFLLWRERLGALLTEWKRARHDGAALLRGPLLVEAQEWFDQRSQDLSEQERMFISESRALRERIAQEERERQDHDLEAARALAEEQKRRAELSEANESQQKEAARKLRWLAISAAVAAVAAVILLVTSVFMRLRAQEQARIAENRRLAAESSSALAKYPPRSLLLAVEAVKAGQSLHGAQVAGEQSLREALAFIGGRVLVMGQPRTSAIQISPDRHWLVTGYEDGMARLWNLSAKDPAAGPIVLSSHMGMVTVVGFSRGDHWLVTGGDDHTVRLWDLSTGYPGANPLLLEGHEGRITTVGFSPDNRWLVTGSSDKTARLWDLNADDPAASPVVLTGHESAVTAVGFSPDNRWLVTGSWDNVVRLTDLGAALRLTTGDANKTIRSLDLSRREPTPGSVVLRDHEGGVQVVGFSPDNRWLVTGNWDDTAWLWDLSAKDPAADPIVLHGHESSITVAGFSQDSRWLVTGSDDKTVRLWNLGASDPTASPMVLHGHEGAVTAVGFTTDNHWLVTGSDDKTVRLWNLGARDPAASPIVLHGHESAVTGAGFSADNRWLVTGSDDKTARLWDLTAEHPASPTVLLGHESGLTAVGFSPDDHWLVTGSWDKTARLWDLSARDPASDPVILRDHEAGVQAVGFSADNTWLVTGSFDNTARLWNMSARDPAGNSVVLRGHEGGITAVGFSLNNRWLVTGSDDRTARLWDLRAPDPAVDPVVLRGHESGVTAVRFSADNHWLVTASWDRTARLWDLTTKDPAFGPVVLSGHEERLTAVAFSTDNRWLVTGSDDKTARLWDLDPKQPAPTARVLPGHGGSVRAVAISSDNHWVATGSDDKTARLWNLNAKHLAPVPVVLRGHESAVTAVGFSADNRWLVTGSDDRTARLWDLSAKDPAASAVVLRGHSGRITAVGFSPDNRWLVTASDDSTARLWQLQIKDLVDLARIKVGRNFSFAEWQLYFSGEPYRKTFADLPDTGESVTPESK